MTIDSKSSIASMIISNDCDRVFLAKLTGEYLVRIRSALQKTGFSTWCYLKCAKLALDVAREPTTNRRGSHVFRVTRHGRNYAIDAREIEMR